MSWPGACTATAKQSSASVEVVGKVPFGAQMQSACGLQSSRPTATFRILRQSLVAGRLPSVTGIEQSPLSAEAVWPMSVRSTSTQQPRNGAIDDRRECGGGSGDVPISICSLF